MTMKKNYTIVAVVRAVDAGDLVITHGCGDIDLLNEQIGLHGDTKEK